jgi:hypothetical protein
MKQDPPSPVELAKCLLGAPGSKERFGRGAEEVLALSRLIAAADASWDKRTLQSFRDSQKLNPQVWGKLVAIARSKTLESIPQEIRPDSYTALYALVVMSADELMAALNEEVVRADASSRSILDWTKAYRLRVSGIEKEIPLTLLIKKHLNPHQRQEMLRALQKTAAAFDADVLEGKGGVRQVDLKAEQRKHRAQEIEKELVELLHLAVERAGEDLRTSFGISTAENLASAKREVFTGFLQVLGNRVQETFWKDYGRAYCLKIARDFNVTDSRTDRYQLKQHLIGKKGRWQSEIDGFGVMVDEVLDTYMK